MGGKHRSAHSRMGHPCSEARRPVAVLDSRGLPGRMASTARARIVEGCDFRPEQRRKRKKSTIIVDYMLFLTKSVATRVILGGADSAVGTHLRETFPPPTHHPTESAMPPIPHQLLAVQEDIAAGKRRWAKIKTLLSWFGQKGRGKLVVETIQESLNEAGLFTRPEFTPPRSVHDYIEFKA